MITSALAMYGIVQIILIIVNSVGYRNIPAMSIVGLIFGLIFMIPTYIAFDEYVPIALLLISINIAIPVISLVSMNKGE